RQWRFQGDHAGGCEQRIDLAGWEEPPGAFRGWQARNPVAGWRRSAADPGRRRDRLGPCLGAGWGDSLCSSQPAGRGCPQIGESLSRKYQDRQKGSVEDVWRRNRRRSFVGGTAAPVERWDGLRLRLYQDIVGGLRR